MSSTELQFRGAAFGGFNRQDVLDFVEAAGSEHARQTEQIRDELESAREKLKEQTAQLSEAEDRERQYMDENGRLKAELEAARAGFDERSDALAQARRQIAELEEQVEALRPDAGAYALLKDRAASIELEAHQRAQMIVDAADDRAREIRERAAAWLCGVRADYDRLRTDVDATVSHTSGELERVQKSMYGVLSEFAAHDDGLADLISAFDGERALEGPK